MEALIDNAIEAAAAGASSATLSLPSSVFLGQYNQRDTYRIEDSGVIIIIKGILLIDLYTAKVIFFYNIHHLVLR